MDDAGVQPGSVVLNGVDAQKRFSLKVNYKGGGLSLAKFNGAFVAISRCPVSNLFGIK